MIGKSKLTFIGLLLLSYPNGFGQKKEIPDSGKASFYHDSFHGQETSNGEDYNKNDFTAAHRTLPFNSIVSVTNKLNEKKVIVRINDRGPFMRSRIIDLTHSAAMKLNMVKFGIVPVKIHVLKSLDRFPMTDSVFQNGMIHNCRVEETALSAFSVFAWQTEFVKHAFYMALSLTLDYKRENVVVRTKGDAAKRRYEVIVTALKEKSECDSLIRILRKDGYTFARILK